MQINGYEMLALTINIIDRSEILNSSFMRSLHVTAINICYLIWKYVQELDRTSKYKMFPMINVLWKIKYMEDRKARNKLLQSPKLRHKVRID